MKKTLAPTKYFWLAFVVLILLMLNGYAVKVLIIFGNPLLFALAILIELILAAIFLFSVYRGFATPESIVKSLIVSAAGGVLSNEYISKVRQSNYRTVTLLRRRFKTNSPFGLPLTLTILLSAFFFINFIGVLIQVVSKGSFTYADARVLNLIPTLRTPLQTTFFSTVTALANSETVILMTLTIAVISWRQHQKFLAAFVLFVAAGEETMSYVIKYFVGRARPAQVLSLIHEESNSFPSGHVVRATVLFGLLAYLIYKTNKTAWAKILTLGIYTLSVFFVAVSRIYLGVHFPSDVWGSVLLGASMLVVVIGTLEIVSRYNTKAKTRIVLANKSLVGVPVGLVIFVLLATPFLIRIRPVIASSGYPTLPSINENTVRQLPIYSETLTGSRMEPVSFVYVGYEDQIINIFENHKWQKADASTISNTLQALAVGFQGRQYLSAPVTPSFLNSKPQDLAFEQATATNSLKQRHHTRLWKTDFALPDGRPIWEATASFDEGVEFAGPAKLPTHHINPNIDAERSYIVHSLELPDNLIVVTDPQLGKNASGDSFFTDGKAALIYLR